MQYGLMSRPRSRRMESAPINRRAQIQRTYFLQAWSVATGISAAVLASKVASSPLFFVNVAMVAVCGFCFARNESTRWLLRLRELEVFKGEGEGEGEP